jgi:hypothetical protein
MDRKGGDQPSRRTPVKAPSGGGTPWLPLAIVGGTIAIVALIAYLIFQSVSDSGQELSAAEKAEQDDSASLPGEFRPTQGRGHFTHSFSPEREQRPFCEGVDWSGATPTAEADGDATPAGGDATPDAGGGETTPAAESTPVPGTPSADETPSSDSTPAATPTQPTDCYNSNPPSSGEHLNVAANVEIAPGIILPRIPPDPNVYPADVIVPREAIPHILEHAGVFVGYHCTDGNEACLAIVADLEDLVNSRIDNNDNRVVMANSPDLPENSVGASSWTRVLNMSVEEWDEDLMEDFIGTHSCRFDPEGFC